MFRDQPLTWLFIIANGCVVLVLTTLIEGGHDHPEMPIISAVLTILVIPIQLILAVCWVCASKHERLTKGALITLSAFVAIALASLSTRGSDIGPIIPAIFLPQVILVCCGFLIANSLGIRCRYGSSEIFEPRKFQFSLMEMFGWTCIVAIWSFGFHYFQDSYSDLKRDEVGIWVVITSLAILVVLTMALLTWRTTWWVRLGSLSLAVMTLAGLTVMLSTDISLNDYWNFAGGYFAVQMYFALGYAVRNLDTRMTSKARVALIRSTLPE